MSDELQRYGVKEARRVFPTVIDDAGEGQRIIITLRGKDRCAIVPIEDLQRLEKADAARAARSQSR